MAIILPNALTTQEIRVLQEFRRLNAETLTLDQVKAIKHPTGGGESPAVSLVDKGWLKANGSGEAFAVTDKAKSFLAIDPRPLAEESADTASDEG